MLRIMKHLTCFLNINKTNQYSIFSIMQTNRRLWYPWGRSSWTHRHCTFPPYFSTVRRRRRFMDILLMLEMRVKIPIHFISPDLDMWNNYGYLNERRFENLTNFTGNQAQNLTKSTLVSFESTFVFYFFCHVLLNFSWEGWVFCSLSKKS